MACATFVGSSLLRRVCCCHPYCITHYCPGCVAATLIAFTLQGVLLPPLLHYTFIVQGVSLPPLLHSLCRVCCCHPYCITHYCPGCVAATLITIHFAGCVAAHPYYSHVTGCVAATLYYTQGAPNNNSPIYCQTTV